MAAVGYMPDLPWYRPTEFGQPILGIPATYSKASRPPHGSEAGLLLFLTGITLSQVWTFLSHGISFQIDSMSCVDEAVEGKQRTSVKFWYSLGDFCNARRHNTYLNIFPFRDRPAEIGFHCLPVRLLLLAQTHYPPKSVLFPPFP